MSIAAFRVGPRPAHAPSSQDAPIHWPSAIVGLVLATTLVVGVSWFAAARRPEARPVTVGVANASLPPAEAPVDGAATTPAGATAPAPGILPAAPPATAAPLIAQAPAPASERLRVADTRGAGVNLRTLASERGARIKTLPEGTLLESIGPDQRADGIVWRNVREPGGSVGWVSSSFVAGSERAR